MSTDSCTEWSAASTATLPGASWMCLEAGALGATSQGCQSRAAGRLPSAGSPATNTWTGSPCAGQLSQLWFLLRLRVWPRVEEGEPGAAGCTDRATDSPLGWGCGFKGVSGKASSRLEQGGASWRKGEEQGLRRLPGWAGWLSVGKTPL